MLIRCPTCASGYQLDPAMLRDGRILRCAHCRDAWVHRTGPDIDDGPEIAAEASAARCGAGEPVPRGQRRIRLWSPRFLPPRRPSWRLPDGTAAVTLAAALLVGCLATVAGKARVVARFPPSEAVFAAIGLPVNLSGLALGEIRSVLAGGDGPPTLTLEGSITNLRPEVTQVPALRIAVRDKNRRELYYWTAPAPKARLAAGETVAFHSRLTAPPRDGQELAVSFAETGTERRRVAEMMPSDR